MASKRFRTVSQTDDAQASNNQESSQKTDTIGLFPMRVVSDETGLTPATIRAWERRYGAIQPSRSEGRTRLFSADDIIRLKLLVAVTEAGYTISAIARLANTELESLLQDSVITAPSTAISSQTQSTHEPSTDSSVNQIIDSYLEAIQIFDEKRAQAIISQAASFLHPKIFALKIAAPILRKTGDLWQEQKYCIAHERLVSSQLKALLSTAFQHAHTSATNGTILTATPPDHLHELGILIGTILAATHRFSVINLGVNLPFDEILWASQNANARIVLLAVSRQSTSKNEDRTLAQEIEKLARNTPIWIGCADDHSLPGLAPSPRYFHSFEALDTALAKLANTRSLG